MSRTTQTQVGLYLSADKAAQLRRVAEARGVTQQELLRAAIDRMILTDETNISQQWSDDDYLPWELDPEVLAEAARGWVQGCTAERLRHYLAFLHAMLESLGLLRTCSLRLSPPEWAIWQSWLRHRSMNW